MTTVLQKKYFELEKNHKKLLGITMVLIEALELAVSNKELNLESTLSKCMIIYPELFNTVDDQNDKQCSPDVLKRESTFTETKTEPIQKVYMNIVQQKPTILIQSAESIPTVILNDKIKSRASSPMSFPVLKNISESYSDSEAYAALKTVNNSFPRTHSVSVSEKNETIDMEIPTNSTQSIPMIVTAKAFEVCPRSQSDFNENQQNDSETSANKITDEYEKLDFNVYRKTAMSKLSNLSDGVKKIQEQIDKSSAEETESTLSLSDETVQKYINDATNPNEKIFVNLQANKIDHTNKSSFQKIKHSIIFNSVDKQVKILETLRKKLIHSLAQDRANTLDIYIKNDIFDIYSHQILFKKLLPLGLENGWDLKLQQVILKFINSVSSIQKGRDYLTSNEALGTYLANLYVDKNHQKGMAITKNKEMIMAVFHKLSVKPNQQLILKPILENVVIDLLENQNLTFYQIRHTLGYLINMCLIPENICSLEKYANDLLQMLGNLLLTKDVKILTEVDRLFYIFMSNSKYQKEAQKLNLPAIITEIAEKCNKRLKSQLERVVSVMSMQSPHNNLETVKEEYLNYIEIELNELEEEVEIGEITSVLDIKEIIKNEEKKSSVTNKSQTESRLPTLDGQRMKKSNDKENMELNIKNKNNQPPNIRKKDYHGNTKRFVQYDTKTETFSKTTIVSKKRFNEDDKNNNDFITDSIILSPENSFIVLDDSAIQSTRIKKPKTSKNNQPKMKLYKHVEDGNFDYCEETKQIQIPLQHGNIFNEYRHSPYKELIIENSEASKTRPNSGAD